jgi:hypothetical protein
MRRLLFSLALVVLAGFSTINAMAYRSARSDANPSVSVVTTGSASVSVAPGTVTPTDLGNSAGIASLDATNTLKLDFTKGFGKAGGYGFGTDQSYGFKRIIEVTNNGQTDCTVSVYVPSGNVQGLSGIEGRTAAAPGVSVVLANAGGAKSGNTITLPKTKVFYVDVYWTIGSTAPTPTSFTIRVESNCS